MLRCFFFFSFLLFIVCVVRKINVLFIELVKRMCIRMHVYVIPFRVQEHRTPE